MIELFAPLAPPHPVAPPGGMRPARQAPHHCQTKEHPVNLRQLGFHYLDLKLREQQAKQPQHMKLSQLLRDDSSLHFSFIMIAVYVYIMTRSLGGAPSTGFAFRTLESFDPHG